MMAVLALVPRWFWWALGGALGGVLALLALWHWHDAKVAAAFKAGATGQAAVDATAAAHAFAAATAERGRLNAVIAARDVTIRETTDAALERAQADIARRAGDAGRLWRARRADSGGAGGADVSGAAGAAALAADAACASAGGLSFEPALAALTDAEGDAARLRAWQAWWAGVSAVDRQ